MSPQVIVIVELVVMPILGLAALLAGFRVLRGPTLADRVVGLELLTTIGIGLAACTSVVAEQTALLDVSLVLALIAFLATLAYARVVGVKE